MSNPEVLYERQPQQLQASNLISTPIPVSSKTMLASSTPIRINQPIDAANASPVGSLGSVMASVGTQAGSVSQHSGVQQSSAGSSGMVPTCSATASGTPPSSATTKTSAEERILRRTSMQVLLPKRPSTDSLSNSPGPSSPGIGNWGETSSKLEVTSAEKLSTVDTKLNRKESYKAQRKNYRREKKRVASELLNSLQDPGVIVLADWLKVRGTLKSWTKLWCVLKPGLLLLYKSPKTKSSHWVGTVLLTSCQVIERPSKKDGFCFKLFHPLDQTIWAPRGPDKETIGAVVQPLPTSYLIFRAPSQAAGKCWMDALELSLRCSALLLRSNTNATSAPSPDGNASGQISHETQWSQADYEKHFNDQGLDRMQAQVQALLDKHHHQYASSNFLTVESAAKCSTSSLNSSRTQTPLFQQLYLSMTNWDRVVANTPDFHKMKKFRKFRHRSKDCSELSDVSDVDIDFCPQRRGLLMKSLSMHSLGRTRLTTDEEDSPRRLSTPGALSKQFISDLDADSQNEGAAAALSGPESDSESDGADVVVEHQESFQETPYVACPEEEFGDVGEQVEELAEENKSLLWFLVKQVRPGMDLSKVVLPTFILEPRSFLDKLSDSYYHADILSRAVQEDDPYTRMKTVVEWYMSGFYKKPKGLKKPYNPIIGERFRCYWLHPSGSRTYYIAEQVSHHPPVSAFYVTNRQDGFCITCSILARSKFYGNSTSAVLEGVASLTLLPRGECYTMTTPYAHCKGILMGTLSMELGGKIAIECENTGYRADIEFKLKPFLGGSENTNIVTGKIKLGKEVLSTLQGHWDTEVYIKDAKTNETAILFEATPETRQKRLKRYCVPIDSQEPMESERLWNLVSEAIRRDDQVGATEEKTVLEDIQRNDAKQRQSINVEWEAAYFEQDIMTGQWLYKYADLRPWDPRNDVKQYESNYRVLTRTRVKAPMVRTSSIAPRHNVYGKISPVNTDSSQSNEENVPRSALSKKSANNILTSIDELNIILAEHSKQLARIQCTLDRMQYAPRQQSSMRSIFPDSISESAVLKALVYTFIAISVSAFLKWLLK